MTKGLAYLKNIAPQVEHFTNVSVQTVGGEKEMFRVPHQVFKQKIFINKNLRTPILVKNAPL